MDRTQCRVWLPKQLCAPVEVSLVMVGWVNAGLKSVDVVVVAACPVSRFSNIAVELEEVLDNAETMLPNGLRSQQKLCVVGECLSAAVHPNLMSNLVAKNEDTQADDRSSTCGQVSATDVCLLELSELCSLRTFQQGDNLSTTVWQAFDSPTKTPNIMAHTEVWAVVSACKSDGKSNGLEWIPRLLSLSLGGPPAPRKDHIIRYHEPVFGSHHFPTISYTSFFETSSHNLQSQKLKATFKRPRWLTALEQQAEAPDMEILMLQLNCAAYVDGIVKGILPPSGPPRKHSTASSMLSGYLLFALAVVVALWATMLYIPALVVTVWLPTFPYVHCLLQRSMTWQTLHIRFQQLMAWPVILLWGGLGPEQPNVAAAHRLAITKHSTWSVLLIDKTFGAIVGLLLLKHHALITQILVQTGQSLTNDVLRTGCVWLMGIPAGFKLNNELATAFGTVSLHLTQSWSTLLYSLIPAIGPLLHILGISGFLLGFTIPAAMVSDMIFLSTLHVSCLHRTIAFLHTNQLRALAALWRLFRGRKRNPLRRRIDTYDCSVEQLVVASLLFTPLLLLLPTTSVFYTFFSMIFLTLSCVQLMLHYVIAIFHCFPFALVATWIIRPEQFPCGVWFGLPEAAGTGHSRQDGSLTSTLRIESASFGDLLKPFLQSLLVAIEWSSVSSFVHKVVSGERYSLNLQLGEFASLPHTRVSLIGFARLSHMAVLMVSGRCLAE